jgi:hypothetical protein
LEDDVEPFAWLLSLMAIAIVAAFFYLKRRQRQTGPASTRDVEVREASYRPATRQDVTGSREDPLP